MNDVSFLDIDLYIESDHDAPALARSLKASLAVSRQDQDASGQVMSFGSGWPGITPDLCLARYCDLIERLNSESRREWDASRSRVFDMGFTSGDSPLKIHAIISTRTLQRLAAIGAELVITFYPVRTARHPWQARVLA
jgi:hypothetical protein